MHNVYTAHCRIRLPRWKIRWNSSIFQANGGSHTAHRLAEWIGEHKNVITSVLFTRFNRIFRRIYWENELRSTSARFVAMTKEMCTLKMLNHTRFLCHRWSSHMKPQTQTHSSERKRTPTICTLSPYYKWWMKIRLRNTYGMSTIKLLTRSGLQVKWRLKTIKHLFSIVSYLVFLFKEWTVCALSTKHWAMGIKLHGKFFLMISLVIKLIYYRQPNRNLIHPHAILPEFREW